MTTATVKAIASPFNPDRLKALDVAISKVEKMGKEYYPLLHTTAVECLLHACHEDHQRITRFYTALSPALRGAFRAWLGRHTSWSEVNKSGGNERRSWLKAPADEAKGIQVMTGMTERRQETAMKIDEIAAANPFYDRKPPPDRDEQIIADDTIVKALDRYLKYIETGNTDGRSVVVHDEVRSILAKAREEIMVVTNKYKAKEAPVTAAKTVSGEKQTRRAKMSPAAILEAKKETRAQAH